MDEDTRYLEIRYWTEEAGWTHLVIDPDLPGIAGIVAVGSDELTEQTHGPKPARRPERPASSSRSRSVPPTPAGGACAGALARGIRLGTPRSCDARLTPMV